MFTSLTKKMILALTLTTLILGGVAMAGEKASSNVRPTVYTDFSNPSMGSDGRRYTTDYAPNQTKEMIDAIDRDHPVATPRNGMKKGYSSDKFQQSTDLLDAINRDYPVRGTGTPMHDAYRSDKFQQSTDLVDAVDHDYSVNTPY